RRAATTASGMGPRSPARRSGCGRRRSRGGRAALRHRSRSGRCPRRGRLPSPDRRRWRHRPWPAVCRCRRRRCHRGSRGRAWRLSFVGVGTHGCQQGTQQCNTRRVASVRADVQPSLAQEQRDNARDRILRATRQVLAERGLATRVDDVAAAAGVGRRTVFRHFETRDALLAAAVTDGIRSYGDHIPRPAPGAALDDWLQEALVAVHGMNARHGRIYWELAFAPDLDGELADVAETRRLARRQLVRRIADWSWQAAGGRGRPPAWVVDAFAVHLSAFATQALAGDFGRRPEEIGR